MGTINSFAPDEHNIWLTASSSGKRKKLKKEKEKKKDKAILVQHSELRRDTT